jgi:hypothetical protein
MQAVLIILLSIAAVVGCIWFVCNTAIYSKMEDNEISFEEHVDDLIRLVGGKK